MCSSAGLWKQMFKAYVTRPPILGVFRKLLMLSRNVSLQTDSDPSLFHELGVSNKLCKCLAAENITVPTVIQHEVLPITLTQTQNCVVESETGTGKTLTFLLPSLQDTLPGLHSLIIVPSRELAIQLEYLAKRFISTGRLSRNVLCLYYGGSSETNIKDAMKKFEPNIVIGTPKTVLEVAHSDISVFKFLRRIILDEADKLLPADKLFPSKSHSKRKVTHHVHIKPTHQIMTKLLQSRRNVQLIASSATINEELVDKLVECGWGENFDLISTSSMMTPKSIRHGFIVESGDLQSTSCDKLHILTEYLKNNPGNLAMVVIHQAAPISRFVLELRQKNIRAVPLHEYTTHPDTYKTFLQQFQSGLLLLLKALSHQQ